MKWFTAGEDLSFELDLIANGVPVTPDGFTASYTVRDHAGAVLVRETAQAPGTSVVIEIPAAVATIPVGRDTATHYVLATFVFEGRTIQQSFGYGLHPFLPLTATPASVRALFGVSYEELPDDDIDVPGAFYRAVDLNGSAFQPLLSGTSAQIQKANRIVVLVAGLAVLPSLKLRVFQTRQNENNTFARYRDIDWDGLMAGFQGEVLILLGDLGLLIGGLEAVSPVIFTTSQPTDPVTNA